MKLLQHDNMGSLILCDCGEKWSYLQDQTLCKHCGSHITPEIQAEMRRGRTFAEMVFVEAVWGPQDEPQDEKTVADSLKTRFSNWIDQRTEKGIETYSRPLTTHNGRDASKDMIEELLDFCQYQEQSRMELVDALMVEADRLGDAKMQIAAMGKDLEEAVGHITAMYL